MCRNMNIIDSILFSPFPSEVPDTAHDTTQQGVWNRLEIAIPCPAIFKAVLAHELQRAPPAGAVAVELQLSRGTSFRWQKGRCFSWSLGISLQFLAKPITVHSSACFRFP